jgi:hypothetical protein
MITIHYTDSDEVVADAKVERWIDEYLTDYLDCDINLHISTENVIHAISARIAEGRLPHYKIKFHYNGITIDIDKMGGYEYHDGFADTMSKCMVRLLCPKRN